MNKISISQKTLSLPGCSLTSKGAIFDPHIPFDQWQSIGETLKYLEKSVLFWIGDWINYGEKAYGEKYAQALEATGYEYGTLRNAAYVASRIELSRRRDNVSFSHHQEVAAMDVDKQEEWLLKASEEKLSQKDLRSAIRIDKIERSNELLKAKAIKYKENELIQIIHSEFQDCSIKEESVDLILTDPPYPKEFLHLWNDLGIFALKYLKPGGFLVTYSGQLYLPEVIKSLACLEFYWLGCLYHKGQQAQRFERNVQNAVKPILIYYKPPLKKQDRWFVDLVESPAPSKEFHEWGQSVEPVEYLLNIFSNINDLVIDPFGGGGTTAVACKKNLRRCVIIEKEKENIEIIKGRIAND